MDYVVNPEMTPNYLDKYGLKIPSCPENLNLLRHFKVDTSSIECDKFTKYLKVPIGLIYEAEFKFQNKFSFQRSQKFKITKNLQKTFNLNSNQKLVMRKIAEELNKIYAKNQPIYLCLQANCGFGKTVLALNFILKCEYNKAFVVTHNKFAASQFESKAKQFLPHATTFVSDDGVSSLLRLINETDFEIPDILIFPSRHLAESEFLDFLQNNYALGIVDEAHVSNFANDSSLRSFYTDRVFPIVLSMTATPRLDNSIHIGKLINTNDYIKEDTPFQKKFIAVVSDKTLDKYQYSQAYKSYMKAQKSAKHVRKMQCISEDINRRKLILSHLLYHYQSSNARIVVLVEFVEEANYYSTCLQEKNIECLTRVSNHEVNNAVAEYTKDRQKYIIVGTVDKLGTGFDLPSCNTVFLTSLYNTRTDIQQYAGRCIRNYPADNIATRTIYAFFIRPHVDINIQRFYTNITKALKETGWTIVIRTIQETL